jgi:protein TonB
MAEQQNPPAEHHYDPLWDEGRSTKKRKKGASVAIIVSIVVHAALFYYVYKTKFVPVYREYSDEAVKVDLVKPAVKPPASPGPP